jgi:hypothetical protein
MTDTDHIRVIVREELNGKVVYSDTCREKHRGLEGEVTGLKEKIKTLDGRFWTIIVLGIGQLCGLILILIKGLR